jgi:hypothetical protein
MRRNAMVTRRGLAATTLLLGVKTVRAQSTHMFKIGCDTPTDHPLRARGGINESRWPEQSKNRITNFLGATRDGVATLRYV